MKSQLTLCTFREFEKEEITTNLGISYETSLTKSDGSGDGASKFSINESSITAVDMEMTNEHKQVHDEAEKENVEHFAVPLPIDSGSPVRTSSQSSLSSDSSSTIANYSLEMDADERKRMKGVKVHDNLNVTNLCESDKLIRSPRKTIYYSEKENMSVVVHEKVEVRLSEIDQTLTENFTMTMSENEVRHMGTVRKTDYRPLGMDITFDESENKEKNLFKKPPVLPIPQPFQMLPKHLIKQNKTQFLSPPIKTPQKQSKDKSTIDQFMDFITSDTPTKKLCHDMCSTKKHGITPQPVEVEPLRKAPKESWNGKLTDYRKSTDILREAGLVLSPTLRKTSFDLDEKTRRTIYNSDISAADLSLGLSNSPKDRKTMFDGEMEEVAKTPETSVQAFDLDCDLDRITHTATGGTKNMTLVKAADIPEVEVDDNKRQTINENDLTFANFNRRSGIINSTNMDLTGFSETTNELDRKVERLLKNPMSVTGVSGSFSSQFLKDVDFNASEPSKVPSADVSMDLASPAQNRPESRATSVRVVSTDNLNISGISRNASVTDDAKFTPEMKNRGTIYAVEDMNVNEEPKTSSISKIAQKYRGTIFGADIDVEKSKEKFSTGKVQPPVPNRGTIYMQNDDIKVESPAPLTKSEIKDQKCRKSIHFDDSIKVDIEHSPEPANISKSRETICTALDITLNDKAKVVKDQKRETIFESPMNMTDCNLTNQQESVHVSQPKDHQRFTIYDNANISDDQRSFKSPLQQVQITKSKDSRVTTFHYSPMNESLPSQAVPSCSSKVPRITIYESDNEMSFEVTTEKKSNMSDDTKTKRQTMYNDEIDIIEDSTVEIVDLKRTANRQTIYENVSVVEAEIHHQSTVDPDEVHETTMESPPSPEKNESLEMESSDMDETLTGENRSYTKVSETIHERMTVEEFHKDPTKNRITTYTDDIEIDREYAHVQPTTSSNRFTIHEDVMEIEDEVQQSPTESEECSPLRKFANDTNKSFSIYQENDSIAKDESTLTNMICSPPPAFTDSPLSSANTTDINPNRMSVIPPVGQQTFVVDNDQSIAISEVSLAQSRRNFANITVAEFADSNDSDLENESDPCMQLTSSETSSRRSSVNMVQYRKAISDYVNISLSQSMMCATLPPSESHDSPVVPAAQMHDLLSTPVNFSSKLQCDMERCKKKEVVPQKTELDVFLEKLNVEPVTIPHFPALEPGFLEREAAKTIEKVDKFLKDRRERLAREAKLQLPEIPSYSFLIENKLAW